MTSNLCQDTTLYACHTPVAVPWHREEVKAQLDKDTRRFVIQPLLAGEATECCARMVVVAKTSIQPRRTVDNQAKWSGVMSCDCYTRPGRESLALSFVSDRVFITFCYQVVRDKSFATSLKSNCHILSGKAAHTLSPVFCAIEHYLITQCTTLICKYMLFLVHEAVTESEYVLILHVQFTLGCLITIN